MFTLLNIVVIFEKEATFYLSPFWFRFIGVKGDKKRRIELALISWNSNVLHRPLFPLRCSRKIEGPISFFCPFLLRRKISKSGEKKQHCWTRQFIKITKFWNPFYKKCHCNDFWSLSFLFSSHCKQRFVLQPISYSLNFQSKWLV